MIHPRILRAYIYRRHAMCMLAADAAFDTAEDYGLSVRVLCAFLNSMGIDARYNREIF